MTGEIVVSLLLFLSILLGFGIACLGYKIVLAKRDLTIERQKLAEVEAELLIIASQHIRAVKELIEKNTPR